MVELRMIEYKHNSGPIFSWTELQAGLTASDLRFCDYKIRIDGVEKNIYHKSFDEEYNKAMMWKKLSD